MNAPVKHPLSQPAPKVPLNELTKAAQETTFLSPRFYTTDFEELDCTNVEPVRPNGPC